MNWAPFGDGQSVGLIVHPRGFPAEIQWLANYWDAHPDAKIVTPTTHAYITKNSHVPISVKVTCGICGLTTSTFLPSHLKMYLHHWMMSLELRIVN